ncbi:MAG: hypothetical protein KC486_04150 [Myxococcales bacterium]|nr:hypothetical protein [Myxococcales bacterium]
MADMSETLRYEWALAGLVAAAGRFVPLPLVHGILRSRAERWVVRRTAASCGLGHHDLDPLWGGDLGTQLARKLLRAPLTLLLFPVRRIAAILSSVRGVPQDAVRPLLLGRAVATAIELGHLSPAQAPEERAARARELRDAFDRAYRHMDFYMLRAALADLMAATPGLRVAVHARALALLGRDVPPERMDCDSEATIDEVAAKLGGSELRELFERFDRELAEGLAAGEAAPDGARSPAVEAAAR